MEAKIASVLNVCPSDKAKLSELLELCMSQSDDANNTDKEDELEEVNDDNDEQTDMTITDCDVALQRASSTSESFAALEETELQNAQSCTVSVNYYFFLFVFIYLRMLTSLHQLEFETS